MAIHPTLKHHLEPLQVLAAEAEREEREAHVGAHVARGRAAAAAGVLGAVSHYVEALLSNIDKARDERDEARARVAELETAEYGRTMQPAPVPDWEQLNVQLAGCLTAAEGSVRDTVAPGAYGYSLAYEKTLLLRHAFDVLADGRSPGEVLADVATVEPRSAMPVHCERCGWKGTDRETVGDATRNCPDCGSTWAVTEGPKPAGGSDD